MDCLGCFRNNYGVIENQERYSKASFCRIHSEQVPRMVPCRAPVTVTNVGSRSKVRC